ncbi:MAG: hypothetical protein LBH07_01390 [Treponema sp.]|jgi:hypothetical protein|nr:hypothetical protein [Treponema sp.]
MLRKIIILILALNCITVLIAQDNKESSDYKLSSYITEYMKNNYSSWDSSRNKIINLFIKVFNNRFFINREYGDQEDYRERTQLRGEAFSLLNEALHNLGFYSDGQDARNGDFKIMISLMTLALLTPEYSSCIIDSAKSIVYGDSWYGYPNQYTVIVLLEALLILERDRDDQQNKDASCLLLQKLKIYLSDIINSDEYDAGELIEEDILFVSGIIQQMIQEGKK